MAKNSNLHKAKANKNDEFYTRMQDIEAEMQHYRPHFKGKVVYCNCDDPIESKFTKFFALNFEFLGLKKLISTSYSENGHGKVFIYTGDKNGNCQPDPEEFEVKELEGNGDFASPECVALLQEADIVVTNPPFSLFREYINLLVANDKKFLVIGNMNAVNYLCPLIKDNKLWLGVSPRNMTFILPDGSESQVNAVWFTNLTHKKRNEEIICYQSYKKHPELFPKYDNYDAIEVSKTKDIPEDYDGVMGVPISFLDKYNPNQFEIVGITYSKDKNPDIEAIRTDAKHRHVGYINGKQKYPRILIRHKR